MKAGWTEQHVFWPAMVLTAQGALDPATAAAVAQSGCADKPASTGCTCWQLKSACVVIACSVVLACPHRHIAAAAHSVHVR
jgi:hypothetical protein